MYLTLKREKAKMVSVKSISKSNKPIIIVVIANGIDDYDAVSNGGSSSINNAN